MDETKGDIFLFPVCPFCNGEISIKEGLEPDGTPRFSSSLCLCRILIYYYAECRDVVITKDEYVRYKKKRLDTHGKFGV